MIDRKVIRRRILLTLLCITCYLGMVFVVHAQIKKYSSPLVVDDPLSSLREDQQTQWNQITTNTAVIAAIDKRVNALEALNIAAELQKINGKFDNIMWFDGFIAVGIFGMMLERVVKFLRPTPVATCEAEDCQFHVHQRLSKEDRRRDDRREKHDKER